MRSCGLRGGARSSRGGPPPWRAPSLQTRGSSLGSSSPPDSWVHRARVLGSGGLERVREVKLQVVRGLRCAFFSGFSVQICLYLCAPAVFVFGSPSDCDRASGERAPRARPRSPVYTVYTVHLHGKFTKTGSVLYTRPYGVRFDSTVYRRETTRRVCVVGVKLKDRSSTASRL